MAERRKSGGSGRKPLNGEGVVGRTTSLFQEQWDQLHAEAVKMAASLPTTSTGKKPTVSVNDALRFIVEEHFARKARGVTSLAVLGSVPCGPLSAALEKAERVDLGGLYKTLKLGADDFGLVANGNSMNRIDPSLPRHINSGDIVVLRQYDVHENQPALIRVDFENGNIEYTLKVFRRDDQGRVVMVDGRGNIIPWPAGIERAYAVAGYRTSLAPTLNISDADLYSELAANDDEIAELNHAVAALRQQIAEATAGNRNYPPAFLQVMDEIGFDDPDLIIRAFMDRVAIEGAQWLDNVVLGVDVRMDDLRELPQQSKAA